MREVEGYNGRVFDDPDLQEMVAEMRHPKLQGSSRFFRGHAQTIGRELAREIKKREGFYKQGIGQLERGGLIAEYIRSDDSPVILTIMRAALPMVWGSLEIFGESPVAFIDAKRKEGSYDPETGDIEVEVSNSAFPKSVTSIENRTLLVPDIMLATGRSGVATINTIFEQYGIPSRVIMSAAIAAKPGVEYVLEKLPNSKVYAAVIDEKLDGNGYIVPGLGDAGDLCFDGGLRLIDLVSKEKK